MKPALSVVIPAFNVASTLSLTLQCLESQTLDRGTFECVFVDDGSTDGTLELLRGWKTSIAFRVLENERNLGRSRTRNRGVRNAMGAWLVFLDGDMFVHPNWLASYYERIGKGDVDVVSGRRWSLLSDAPGALPVAGWLQAPEDSFARLRERCTLGQRPEPAMASLEHGIEQVCRAYPDALTRALAFITSNVALSRAAFVKAGPFCRWMRRGEDTELGIRLAAQGARFGYLAEAEAIHPTFRSKAADDEPETFPLLMLRHPYSAVLLWYLWAARLAWGDPAISCDGPIDVTSLESIARAEMSGAAAAVDCQALLARTPLGGELFSFKVALSDMVGHLERVFDEPRARVRRLLLEAVERGLMTGRTGSEPSFDLFLTRDWLERQTTLGYQSRFARSFSRAHQRRCLRGRPAAPPLVVRWKGTYEVTVPNSVLAPVGADIRVNLALPTSTRCQTDVVIDESWPRDLRHHERDGLVFAYPAERAPEAGGMRKLGYSFSCTVSEWNESSPRTSGDTAVDDRFLRRTVPRDQLGGFMALLSEAAVEERMCTADKARAIYGWMLANVDHRMNGLGAGTTAGSGFGHCVQLSRLFVALCRTAGVPAREVCGALAGRRLAGSGSISDDCTLPFAHTWTEFWNDGEGWIPVELLAVASAKSVVTALNFDDPSLREEFVATGLLEEEYYFGRLDPFRIHATPWAIQLPSVVARRDGRWVACDDPTLGVRHRLSLECDLEGQSAGRQS